MQSVSKLFSLKFRVTFEHGIIFVVLALTTQCKNRIHNLNSHHSAIFRVFPGEWFLIYWFAKKANFLTFSNVLRHITKSIMLFFEHVGSKRKKIGQFAEFCYDVQLTKVDELKTSIMLWLLMYLASLLLQFCASLHFTVRANRTDIV